MDTRIHVTTAHLHRLQAESAGVSFLPHGSAVSVLNGRHRSRLRGRGMDFEEMRSYLPGDDIRSIDWKATAKTGKPYVRVMREERDRPAMLVVDQRVAMFFGSTLNMKSVTAAEAAAISAARIQDQGDRVGGVIFDDTGFHSVLPTRGSNGARQFVNLLTDYNQRLNANKIVNNSTEGESSLNSVLGQVARIAHHNHLVIVFSDFDGIDETTHRRLAGIAEHNDLILMLTHDPVARQLNLDRALPVSDATDQAEVRFDEPAVLDAVLAMSAGRLDRVLDWQKEINLSILPLNCGEPTLGQIRTLLGAEPPRRRIR